MIPEKITHVENKIYKNLVLTHRMHRYQTELYQKEIGIIKMMIILTTISVFIVLIAPLDYNISWWVKFILALLDLFLILYESGFRPEEKLQDHKAAVKMLLPIRNTFAIAMSDYILGRISEEKFLEIRDNITEKADVIYSTSPQVSRKAMVKAKIETRKYLEKNADYLIRNIPKK